MSTKIDVSRSSSSKFVVHIIYLRVYFKILRQELDLSQILKNARAKSDTKSNWSGTKLECGYGFVYLVH